MAKSARIDFDAVYRGRRVLVTGHTGFKGSWLCAWLQRLGAEVHGIALTPESSPNLYEANGLDAKIASSRILDIRRRDDVRMAVQDIAPEIVLHLAAQALVRQSYANPIETFETNIIGTANLLDACRMTQSVRAVVCVTTDKVYLNREWPWPYRETDRLGGLDPYSASKACAELVSYVYQRNLCRDRPDLLIATARGGNVVGGGDWSTDRIVPDIVRALQNGEPIRLRNPSAIRPWQHVLELCEGYLELGARLFGSEPGMDEAWNFGPRPSNEVSVQTLVDATLDVWNRSECRVETFGSPLHEAQLLRLDISKALARLHWQPRLDVRETLSWTAEWYRSFYAGIDPSWDTTSRQIEAYSAIRDVA